MAYSIVGIEEFENDYDQILDYPIDRLESRQAALRLVDEMDCALALLAENPFIDRPHRSRRCRTTVAVSIM